jgi:hypothetical protein
METCEECRFFRGFNGRKYGECARHAPVPNEGHGMSRKWPVTMKDSWCGDFKAVGDAEPMLSAPVRLSVAAGDVVVFQCNRPLSAEQAARLRESMNETLGDGKAVVLAPGMRVDSVLSMSDAAAQGVGGQKSSHSEIF